MAWAVSGILAALWRLVLSFEQYMDMRIEELSAVRRHFIGSTYWLWFLDVYLAALAAAAIVGRWLQRRADAAQLSQAGGNSCDLYFGGSRPRLITGSSQQPISTQPARNASQPAGSSQAAKPLILNTHGSPVSHLRARLSHADFGPARRRARVAICPPAWVVLKGSNGSGRARLRQVCGPYSGA
jgi:hypothetical protein